MTRDGVGSPYAENGGQGDDHGMAIEIGTPLGFPSRRSYIRTVTSPTCLEVLVPNKYEEFLKMRDHLNGPTIFASVSVLVAVLAFSSASHAQGGRAAAPSPTANLPFDPHDLSGIWRFGGNFFSNNNAPQMTPAGKAKYDANIPGLGGVEGRNKPLGNDPMMICDPLGFPRVLSFGAYPMEMVQLPGRIIQFFDFFYTHRTIWTDGRKLPEDPEPAWYG